MSDGSTASEIYIGLGGGGAADGPRQSLVLKRANRTGELALAMEAAVRGLRDAFVRSPAHPA